EPHVTQNFLTSVHVNVGDRDKLYKAMANMVRENTQTKGSKNVIIGAFAGVFSLFAWPMFKTLVNLSSVSPALLPALAGLVGAAAITVAIVLAGYGLATLAHRLVSSLSPVHQPLLSV